MKEIILCLKHYEKDLSSVINALNSIYKTSSCDTLPSLNSESKVLVLTDDNLVTERCMGLEVPCAIVLHENNKDQNFPMGSYCIEGLDDLDIDYLNKIYQRAKGLPWFITQTQRLILREETVTDVTRLFDLYKDEEITMYMEDLLHPQEKEEEYTQNYIDNVYSFYGYGIWVIILKETGEIIGRCGLEYKEGFDGLELGFMLGKNYWHKGYALEACRAVLDYANEYLEQHNFQALVHKENTASRKLCERLGFSLSGNYDEEFVQYILENK